MNRFFAMPPAASAFALRVDALLWSMTAVTGIVAAGIFMLIIVFSLRYRRGRHAARHASPASTAQVSSRWLEIAWTTIPLLIFMAFYVWGARLYFDYATAPAKALEIYVVAKQWVWTLEHSNGRREINELHVPRDEPIRLVMISQDVIHSFYIPALRIKHDVLPGRYESLWFTPTRSGEYHLFCSEYCGTDHSRMGGRVLVMEPQDYGRWLETGSAQQSLASRGAVQFRNDGCSGCHAGESSVRAPSLNGLFGQAVPLQDGNFVTADERYLRDSILQPALQITAGYPDAMPSYAGRLSDEQLLELIEYIKSLSGTPGSDSP